MVFKLNTIFRGYQMLDIYDEIKVHNKEAGRQRCGCMEGFRMVEERGTYDFHGTFN